MASFAISIHNFLESSVSNNSLMAADNIDPQLLAVCDIKFARKCMKFLIDAYMNFQTSTKKPLIEATEICYQVLVPIGIVGGILGLSTMMHNKYMQVTSFVYHKVLMAANLIFCFNWAIGQLIKLTDKSGMLAPQYHTWYWGAYYNGVISRYLASTAGYIWLYMSLLIALDRCVALAITKWYQAFCSKKCCCAFTMVTLLMSGAVHSWSPWVEQVVTWQPFDNKTIKYYPGVYQYGTESSRIPATLYTTKNVINLVFRICFPVLLATSTGVALVFYLKKRNSDTVKKSKRFRRNETYLFLLMIVVVVLVFIQVLPRETLRILQLVYPVNWLSAQVWKPDNSNTMADRLHYLDIQLWGHDVMGPVANICTLFDRTLMFYLYLILNPMFRRASVQFLCATALKRQQLAESRLLRGFVSRGEGGSSEEERNQLLLLISPQLATNFESVFAMTHNLCKGFLAMKGKQESRLKIENVRAAESSSKKSKNENRPDRPLLAHKSTPAIQM